MRIVSFNGKSSMDFDYKYLNYSLGNLEVENLTDNIEGKIVHYGSYVKERKLTIQLCIKNESRDIREARRYALESFLLAQNTTGPISISISGISRVFSGYFDGSGLKNENNSSVEEVELYFSM